MFDLKYCGCGQSSPPDGTEGTVTVGWFQGENKVVHGCIVKNDKKFRKLIDSEEKKPKYFAYIPRVEMNSNETFKISVHRFTDPESPKECEVQDLQNKKLDVHDDHGYIFVPCEDESEKKTKKFNKSRFLKKHSKSIIEIPPDDVCKSGNVMGLSKKEEPHGRTTFFSFEIKASSSNSYYIENDRFDKLEDTGPLLTENNEKKTLVGYYEKSGNEIKIHTLSTDDKEPRTVLAERALSNEMSDSPAHGVEGITVESTGNQQANLQPQTDTNTQGSQTDSIAGGVQGSTVESASENQVDATERPNNVSSSRNPTQNTRALLEHDERRNQTRGNNDQLRLPEGYKPDDVIHKDKKYRRLLLYIATNLTADDDWTELGSNLGITSTDLEGIRTNYEEVKERAYQMLIKWTECTKKPTLKLLTDALKDAKKIQLVDEITDVLRQNSYRNPPQGGQQATETHFRRITNDIVHDWKFIGRYLATEESIIHRIDRDSKTARGKASQMLIKWKQRNGRNATLEVLKAALQDAGREDVVSKLEELLNE